MNASLLKEARDIVRAQPKSYKTKVLGERADRLQECYDLIKISLTRGALSDFVASATLVLISINDLSANTPNTPLSGSGTSGAPTSDVDAAKNVA